MRIIIIIILGFSFFSSFGQVQPNNFEGSIYKNGFLRAITRVTDSGDTLYLYEHVDSTFLNGFGGGGSTDSTTVVNSYGTTITESPANQFNIKVDSSKFATPYDLSLVDQSSTNEKITALTWNDAQDSLQVVENGTIYRTKITGFGTGTLSSLNGETGATQIFATGTSGTDFTISSATNTHTFNIPSASTTARGLITTSAQTIAGAKTFSLTGYPTNTITLLNPTAGQYGSGITFTDSYSSGYLFRNGAQGTYTFDGSGAAVANKKLHIDGGVTIGTGYDATAVSANSLNVEGTMTVGSLNLGTPSYGMAHDATGKLVSTLVAPGTVSSVGLAVGTSGADIAIGLGSSPVTSTGTINLNIPTASASNRGALSSSDWNTFNGKLGGSGANTQLAYFNASNTLTSNANMTYISPRLNIVGGMDVRKTVTDFTICIGAGSGNVSNVAGADNVWVGRDAGRINTGSSNVGMGTNALYSNTSGGNNMAIGLNSLFYNTTGTDNTAIGTNSLSSNTSGYYNVGLGASSLSSNTTGYTNVGIGYTALLANTTGISNIGMGWRSLYSNTTGSYNVGIGEFSLYSNISGSRNIALGFNAGQFETGSDKLYIDPTGTGTPLLGGNFSSNYVGINTAVSSLAATLHVTGDAIITGSTGTPTTITGRNASGNIGNVSLSGTGLSLSGGTLTNTDPDQSITNELQNLGYTAATGALTITGGTGVTLPVATASVRGLVPTPPNNTTTFLRGDATFALPDPGAFTARANGITSQVIVTDGTDLFDISSGTGITVTPTTGTGIMTYTLTPSADIGAIEALNTNGMLTRTGTNTWAGRTITAGNGIAVTNGDGVSGNPTLSFINPYASLSTGATANISITAGTPAKVPFTTASSDFTSSTGFSFSDANDQITVTNAGTYEISYSFSASPSVSGSTNNITATIFIGTTSINGVGDLANSSYVTNPSANNISSQGHSRIMTLSAGAILDLRVNFPVNTTLSVYTPSVTIKRLY